MANLLVTGAAGFIGANFVHYWTTKHPHDLLVALDVLGYAGNTANLRGLERNDSFRFIRGDIRDFDLIAKLLREYRCDTIVHFAAETHVDRSIHGPDEFLESNVIGTHGLLKAAKAVWLDGGSGLPHRFHHVSTDEVYGSLKADDPAFSETTPYSPNSPYSASKAASDHLVNAYHHTYGLDVTISNCSNNYGRFQFPEKLIPLILINILHGRTLPIYGDGLNVRDWLHVDEHCRAIELILRNGRPGEKYNVGGNCEIRNLDVVDRVCSAVDAMFAADSQWVDRFPDGPCRGTSAATLKRFVKDRPGHDRRYAIDGAKIQSELGFVPCIPFDKGLRATIQWYLEHEDWWRQIMDGRYRQWMETNYVGR